MAAAESATVFFARAAELGLGDLKSRFEARGWCSFADFAFACSDFKNSNPAIFEEEVIKPLVGEDVSRIPKIRRLFMQSYIVGSAEMERYANPQADAKVNMHPEDRAARTATLTKRLNGFTVTNQSEPSFGLIDKFANMLQKGTVRYVPWEKCTSRDAEVLDESEDPGLKLTSDGVFAPVERNIADADVSGEFRWDLAQRRRCLAMDIAGLMTYEAGLLWHETMKTCVMAPPPPGFKKVSWAQLLNADKKVFQLVAEKCNNGCKCAPGESVTNFEKAFKEAIFDFSVRMLLQPLQGSSSSSDAAGASSVPSGIEKELKSLKHRLKQSEDQLRATRRRLDNNGGGKGGRGKGKFDRNRNRPQAMEGKARSTANGDPICFAYNLQGCNQAKPGERCPRGWHLCADPRCQTTPQPHSMSSHH